MCPRVRVPGAFASLLTGGAMMLAAAASVLNAQESALPSLTALRIQPASERLSLDGALTEAAWQRAPMAGGLQQREPHAGDPATETTEIRVLYDDENLYVGILARDSDPTSIIARILQRDKVLESDQFFNLPRFAGDDAIAILLDPFHDHRNATVFATNPNGAEFEALLTDEGREFNVDWRAVWQVRAQRVAEGWSAEFSIPFRSLRYPANRDGQPWGFNVYRVIRRKNEEVLWSSWSRDNEGFHRVSRAGHLEGLADLPRSGLNVDLKPFVLGGVAEEQEAQGIDTDPELDVGLDVKYEVHPGLVLDATLNTDFAQVEVDDEQVNLTRFSLFFPEKREFFLENAGIFDFGVRGGFEPPPFLLFFSRRIGIAEDGEVPVLGGVRLTGRAGKQTVGLLNVVTDSAFEDPRTNFAVARIKRDIGTRHYVGAMLTDRRYRGGWNTAGGVDFSFWPTNRLNLQGFAAATGTSDGEGNDIAYRAAVDFQQDQFGFGSSYLMIGPDAVADAGFITREDVRRAELYVRVTPRPRMVGIRKIDIYALSQLVTRTDGELQDWAVGPAFSPEWNSGESLTLFFQRGFNRIDESFELSESEGVEVPPGDYDLLQFGWFANTSRNRPLVLGSSGMLQATFGGHIHSLSGDLTLNPNANLSVNVRYGRNWVDVPDGSFTADLAALRLSYAFSVRLFANALLQYNNFDNSVSANVRINFIHTPGSDLFVVFNEQRGADDGLWDLDNRGAVVKLTYLKRF